MKQHTRVMLFCVAILAAPLLFALGERLAGLTGALLLSGGVTLASLVYMILGKPAPGGTDPSGTPPPAGT